MVEVAAQERQWQLDRDVRGQTEAPTGLQAIHS